MTRTNQDRFDEAVAYLKDNIDDSLATDVVAKVGKDSKQAGAEISLSGAGYWKSGTEEQHKAVRALLLCYYAYFRPKHSPMDRATPEEMDKIRKAMLGKTDKLVNTEIMLFLPDKPSLDKLARAAEFCDSLTGVVDPWSRTRADKTLSKIPICYDGVKTWLYQAGFVSKRWLAREGMNIKAQLANEILGDGKVVKKDKWNSIEKGYIWNIQRVGDPTTCHWGLSLGGNIAIACNNTSASPYKTLEFIAGGPAYGKFKFTDICEVLNGASQYYPKASPKYPEPDAPDQNIVVKKINPMNGNFY